MIFLHPFGTSLVGRMEDHYFPNTIGHPLDSALCVGQLVFDGYLERFPELKICIAHGGGYIPGYWGRFDHAFAHREDCRVTIKKKPSEYLKKLYFDTVVFDERELKHLIEIWGADHIMLGTDYPFDMAEPDPVGFLGRVKGVSKNDMALVAGGNAERLLGLPARAKSKALATNQGYEHGFSTEIKEHMDVISSDKKTVGKVDHLEGTDKIKLTKQSSPDGSTITSFRCHGSTMSISTSI